MLKKISLTNFRRHRDLQVAFGDGLTVIRALNEQGKSTLLEAISYAMFGVKAIRDPLEAAVTWGEAVGSLKVVLVVDVDGVEYTISRAKSGAEISYSGGTVTGQNEVTNFVAKLLRMDAGAAQRLVMSNQNQIRGALDDGPKAATELIERLAEFSQIDDLIEKMQEKLALGSPALIEANLAQAQATLEAAEGSLSGASEIDDAEFATVMARLENERIAAVESLTAAKAGLETAEAAQVEARRRVESYVTANAAVLAAEKTSDRLSASLKDLDIPPEVSDFDDRVAGLEQSIASAEQAARDQRALSRIYGEVEDYLAEPVCDRVEGTLEELQTELASAQKEVNSLTTEIAKLDGDIRLHTAALLHGSCSFCGKDFSAVPEVAERNSATTVALNKAKDDKQSAVMRVEHLKVRVQSLKHQINDAAPVMALVEKHPDNVMLADSLLPPYLVWTGADVNSVLPSTDSLRSQLADLRHAQKAHTDAISRRDMLANDLAVANGELATALEALKQVDTGSHDTEAEDAAVREARKAVDTARDRVQDARMAVDSEQRARNQALERIERARADVDGAKENIKRFEGQLEELSFNNALLKRVRQVRPLVADKVWGLVLNAVGQYFSEIRGVKSRVTKTSDGFNVDGHSLSSMSGSTKDSLGLAIRVALVRTFLPTAPFLILDEPAAAMDDERTDNLLGFISRCGFHQTLLVTHENVSETVADHIITL